MKKRCDLCGQRVPHRFTVGNLNVGKCCKGTLRSSDAYTLRNGPQSGPVKPAVSKARADSERMQAAKAKQEARNAARWGDL